MPKAWNTLITLNRWEYMLAPFRMSAETVTTPNHKGWPAIRMSTIMTGLRWKRGYVVWRCASEKDKSSRLRCSGSSIIRYLMTCSRVTYGSAIETVGHGSIPLTQTLQRKRSQCMGRTDIDVSRWLCTYNSIECKNSIARE